MRKRMLLAASAGVLSAVAMTMGAVGSAGADLTTASDPTQVKAAGNDGPSVRYTCSDRYPDKDHSKYPKPFSGTTNVRSGPDTDCARTGLVGSVNKADYHCEVIGESYEVPGHNLRWNRWTYLRFKDNYYGFVRSDQLSDGGSDVAC